MEMINCWLLKNNTKLPIILEIAALIGLLSVHRLAT